MRHVSAAVEEMTDHFLDPLGPEISWNSGLPVQDLKSAWVEGR
jgi:hypothetical protein